MNRPVQSTYGRTRPTPARQSIWIVVEDPPGEDDAEKLENLALELKTAVKDLVRSKIDRSRSPQPACDVTTGIVEATRLEIYRKER